MSFFNPSKKHSESDDVKPNLKEIGAIVREMQNNSVAASRAANQYNEKGAAIVQQGVEDKMRSRGWPVNSSTPKPVDKKLI